MQLAAQRAGYSNLNEFSKQAFALQGGLVGAGLGAGVGALADSDNRWRGAVAGAGVGAGVGAASGGLAGHLMNAAPAAEKAVAKTVAKEAPKAEKAVAKAMPEAAPAAAPAAASAPMAAPPSIKELVPPPAPAPTAPPMLAGVKPVPNAVVPPKIQGKPRRNMLGDGPLPSSQDVVKSRPGARSDVSPQIPEVSGVSGYLGAPELSGYPNVSPNLRIQPKPVLPDIDVSRYRRNAVSAARANFDVPDSSAIRRMNQTQVGLPSVPTNAPAAPVRTPTARLSQLPPEPMPAHPPATKTRSGVQPKVPAGVPVRSGGTPVFSADPRTGEPIFMGTRS